MANSLLTISMITREAVRLWKNTNLFIQNIDSQYDDQFARRGAKIGTQLRIRLPNDFTPGLGPAVSVQDTSEQQTVLTLGTQRNIAVSYSSLDRGLALDDFSIRVLAPMVNALAGAVAVDVMSGVEGGISNYVANVDGSNNVLIPTATTWLQAGAILDTKSAPRQNRKIIMHPITQARTVASLAGLFNPNARISRQTEAGEMFSLLGFDWYADQTVLNHVTAGYTAGFTVSGAGQTGSTLVTSAITGGLNVGDIITMAGVNAVNRITKQDSGLLSQHVVTAAVASGGTSVSIYPAIIPPNADGAQVQYQTVTASPANGATVSVVTNTASSYRKNFAYAPEAVTLVTADLEMPDGVHEKAREAFDGVAMRMISAYDVKSDQFITRLDVLYGYLFVRPEWAVVVADVVP